MHCTLTSHHTSAPVRTSYFESKNMSMSDGKQRSILSFLGNAAHARVQKKGDGAHRAKSTKQIQLHIDLGQKAFAPLRCQFCGMLYSKGNTEDERAHNEFHSSLNSGFSFKGWSKERVVADLGALGRLIHVLPTDSAVHVRRILDIMGRLERSMGFAEGWLLPSFQEAGQSRAEFTSAVAQNVFLHVSHDKSIIGVLVLEALRPRGYPLAEVKDDRSSQQQSIHDGSGSLNGMSRAVTVPRSTSGGKTESPAICGVRCIWVSSAHRRQGIATKLMDVARCRVMHGFVVDRRQFAFAHLTQEGRAFANKYCGENLGGGTVVEYEAGG